MADLTDLAVQNANVMRIRYVIETNFEPVRRDVVRYITGQQRGHDAAPTADEITAWRQTLTGRAAAEAGRSYSTYLRLRLRAVVDDLATLISTQQGNPLSSFQTLFVAQALRAWADRQHLFDKSTDGTPQQLDIINALDLAHLERRIRFLIAAMSWWYHPTDTEQARTPPRTSLDLAKHRLYNRVSELDRLAELLADDDDVRALVDDLFGRGRLVPDPPEAAEVFVAAHIDELDRLQQFALDIIGPQLTTLTAALDADIAAIGQDWTEWARNELLTRHLGFAFWDIILYPIEAVSGVNERDHVELMRLSPNESTVLAQPAGKQLKGVTLGHFGAFFSREGRENDYLWGRLDAAERLIVLLATPPAASVGWFRKTPTTEQERARISACLADCKQAAHLIVASEQNALAAIPDRLAFVTTQTNNA